MHYLNSEHGDVGMMAEDLKFIILATGQEHHGREVVAGMLAYFYHVAFDATAPTQVFLCDEKNGAVESIFIGKHIGEFTSIPATSKEVCLPLCVVYNPENSQIKRGRVSTIVMKMVVERGQKQNNHVKGDYMSF